MTDTLLDATIRRDAQLLRFGTYLKSEYITPTMQGLSKSIPKELVGLDELNKAERTKLAVQIRRLISTSMGAMFDNITNELHILTDDEAEFMLELYDDYTTATMVAVNQAAVVATASNALLSLDASGSVNTGVWNTFVKQNISTTTRMLDGVILKGFRDGGTLQSITSELRGSYNRGTKQYTGGILNGKATRYAETLARTGVSHYTNQARTSFANKNDDILDEKVFFATLDNCTTTTCMGFHTNTYKIADNNAPVLPLHYNERSVYLFGGKGIDPLEGDRPLTGGKDSDEAKAEFERRTKKKNKLRRDRAEKRADGEVTPTTKSKVTYKGRKDSDIFDVEVVSAKVTSQQFLERQPLWFVESTLGKTRAKLFKEGGLKIDKFTDLQGRQLSLAELKKTAAGEKAFRKSGL